MTSTIVTDLRYKIEKVRPSAADLAFAGRQLVNPGRTLEMEAFLARATSGKIEMEIVHLEPGEVAPIPASFSGQTLVNYVGDAPLASLDLDQFGNIQLSVPRRCAMEVVFNSPVTGSNVTGKKFQEKKIVYLMR